MKVSILNDFLDMYGAAILYTALTAAAGYFGVWAKRIYTKYINDKTKQKVAQTVVKAVEQIYADLHGKEKLNMALASASEMLKDKGIKITDLELRMLIESALAEFNGVFKKANGGG